MPVPPPKGLSSGASSFLKGNAKFAYGGGIGLAFLASDVKGIFDADNKLKALLKTAKDFILIRVAMVGIFTAISGAVKSLVRDTGSLDQALKKLNQMQVFSRQLAGFVGGVENARKRIAELAALSERGPFKFEDLAQANKSLEVFTRGAYSSVSATKEIGEAAIATGNDVADTARAVGAFYDNLRSGQPVGEAAEQLRQMGLISQTTADHLTKMAAGGEDVAGVFNVLTQALKSTAAGAESYKNELAGITSEHQKAIEILQEKFAMPFTQAEAKNIQNYTAATKAFTPAVAEIAKSLSSVYSGFSTAKSATVKFVAELKPVQSFAKHAAEAIEILSVAAVAFGVYAAMQLTPIIAKLGGSLAGLGPIAAGAAIALRAAAIITVWSLVAQAIIQVAGAFINLSEKGKQAKKDFQDWSKAQDEATSSLREQVAAISTLTDKNAALAASMKRIIELQKTRNELQDKIKHWQKERAELTSKWHIIPMVGPLPKWWWKITGQEASEKADYDKYNKAAREEQAAKAEMRNAAAAETVNKKLVETEAQRRFEIEQQTKGVVQRDAEARAGLKYQADAERKLGELESRRVTVQEELTANRERFKERKDRTPEEEAKHRMSAEASEREITDIMKERQKIQLAAPEFSATKLEARAEQLRMAKEYYMLQKQQPPEGATEDEKRALEIKKQRAKTLAGPEALAAYTPRALEESEVQAGLAKKREEAAPRPEELRQERVQTFEIQTDIRGRQARSRGDVRGAEAAEDLSAAAKNFEQLLPLMGKDKAASVALQETQADITQQYQGAAHVVSSMQAVGGGGNASGVDPAMASARRREELQSRMVELLQILTGQETQQPTTPTFQQ